MGRPPSNGAPAFRFNSNEVAQMESILREHEGQIPTRELLVALAEKFSNSPERAGKVTVQMKQVWNWFQNRRYALRSKLVKSPGKLNVLPMPREEVTPVRNVTSVPLQITVTSGPNVVRSASETPQMEFEARSARDGAWYDVQAFISHRYLETGNPEVLVRFAGFGPEEDEWVNVRKHVRQRSLPCESSECVAVLPGDLILCFQEGKEQALYFDAHVLDAQRRRHDVRGCRCRFLVRYDHDQSEEIVPLRKVCRRPETDYRLQQLHAANESASASASLSLESEKPVVVDSSFSTILRVTNPSLSLAAGAAPLPSVSAAGLSASAPDPAPAPVVAPSPVLVPFPALATTSAPALTPALSPAPAINPAPALAPSSAPAPTPDPSLAPSPTPAISTALASPDQGTNRASASPAPATTSASVRVSVPATNKAVDNIPGILEGGATAQENCTSIMGGSTALEAENAESINPETSALVSNLLLGQDSDTENPATAAVAPEKSEVNNSGHPELAGSCGSEVTADATN